MGEVEDAEGQPIPVARPEGKLPVSDGAAGRSGAFVHVSPSGPSEKRWTRTNRATPSRLSIPLRSAREALLRDVHLLQNHPPQPGGRPRSGLGCTFMGRRDSEPVLRPGRQLASRQIPPRSKASVARRTGPSTAEPVRGRMSRSPRTVASGPTPVPGVPRPAGPAPTGAGIGVALLTGDMN